MVLCYVCNKDVSLDKDITCDLCKGCAHGVCAELSRTEIQCLKSKDRKISFHCTSCSDMKHAIAKINELTTTVDALKKEILGLKTNSGTPIPTAPSNNCCGLKNTETVIQEVLEREKRRRNIIIYNVPEQVDLTRSESTAADTETVKEILTTLEIPVIDIKAVRLGKFDSTKVNSKRPIRVCLCNDNDVIKSLKNSVHLKSIDKFKTISVSKDKTPFQMNLYRSVKTELDARRAAGETDIFIKHIRDIPQIVRRSEN